MDYNPIQPTWKCGICAAFVALTLRVLMSHYFSAHRNDPNFLVRCGVNNCPATFRRYHSFYKHVAANHKDVYNNKKLNPETPEDDNNELDSSDSDLPSEQYCSSSDEEQLDEDEDDEAGDPDLERTGAFFILKVKERHKITQVAMNNVIESTSGLLQTVLHSVRRSLMTAWENRNQGHDFGQTIDNTMRNVPNPFERLGSNFLQMSYIKKHLNYVEAKEVVLGRNICRVKRKNKSMIVEKDDTITYVPFLESLAQLLSNKNVAKLVLKEPNFCKAGVYYDICDGQLYRNDRFFLEKPDALQVIIYHDAVEVCNPLGSHAGWHKVDMFYYTLGNLPPKVRSKHCAVRLLGIANAKIVKKYGYNSVLQPMLADIKKLECGHRFVVFGEEREIFGKVVSCTGDTEGQHEWAGFKVGVGFAFQKCRHCHCQFLAMQEKFLEEDFSLRTKASYERHCKEIDEAPTDANRSDLQTTYGINQRSSLCDLHDFDISIQLPQDIMHTLLEGVVQYELRHLLLHYINTHEFTLAELNAAINNQEYGYSEVADKPGPLRESVFQGDERYKLKYKAAQARLFLRLLPFILCSLVDEEDPFYSLLTQLIAIVQIVFSPVVTLETTNLLKMLIAEHLSQFKGLFPDINITPKQHYLIHIPRMIKQLGPLVRHSCFAFESAHNYFKEIARKQNFKNLPKSLAERCQLLECSNFCDSNENGKSHPLFSSEINYGVLTLLTNATKDYVRSKFDQFGLLPGVALGSIYKASWVVIHGTKFCKDGIIICKVDEGSLLPIFGSIEQIWVVSDFIYFQYMPYDTMCFSEQYQAYHVKELLQPAEESREVCSYGSIVDFNVLHIHKDNHGEIYVPVKYDIQDVLEQHIQSDNPLKF